MKPSCLKTRKRNCRVGLRPGLIRREMVSCVGGAPILHGALRLSLTSNSMSARWAPIWPDWAFASFRSVPNTPMPTQRHRLRSKKLCKHCS